MDATHRGFERPKARIALREAGKADALIVIVGWSALWVCGALALSLDAEQTGLVNAYALTALAGLVAGTRSYLKICREVC